jgi:adenylate cyclase
VSEFDLRHRLAAVLAADAAGYSRLMAADEVATVAALDAARALFRAQVEANHGRVIDMAGDSVLAVFETAAGAAVAAMNVQRELNASLEATPEDRRMRFRIGVHLGDLIEKPDGTVYGDGVNIASRLQALAEPGGVLVSDGVHGAVRGKIGAHFIDQGDQTVKNIAHPVHAFRLVSPEPSPATARKLPLPDKPSLAVLPFTNMSGDPEQEYFADGITEDIITDVSKISGLLVIARNSSFTFKHQSVDIRDVGKKLGVRHVLEGSVRKAGMRVRINVQLIDAETGGHVWAERYDRDLEDIFLVQDEVTQTIVRTLEVTLSGGEKARREDVGKVHVEAYDCLIRARNCLLRFTPATVSEARTLLERAIAVDPGLAQAYAYLAILTGTEYLHEWNGRTADDLEDGLRLAHKACEVDPSEPMGYEALGVVLTWQRKLDEAEHALRRAIELDPNLAVAIGSLGNVLHFGGQHAPALDWFARALRLDPNMNLWIHAQGRTFFSLGRYVEAEACFKRRLIHLPDSDVSRAYLASLYGHTGRQDEARRVWAELKELHPEYEVSRTLRVLPYRDRAPLERFLEGLRKAGLAG